MILQVFILIRVYYQIKMMPQLKDSIQIENGNVYYCQKGVKTQIKSQNKWRLGLIQQKFNLSNGSDTNIPLGNQAVRIIYKKDQCIYLRAKDNFYVLSIPFTSQQNDIIEYRLQSSDVKLINWEQASVKAKDDIKAACGKNVQSQFSSNSSNSSKFNLAVKIGGLFGSINNKISKPMKQVNDAAVQKIASAKQQTLSEESKNKWEKFKSKTSEINKNVGQIIKPAANKISGLTNKIGDKFQNSQNSVLKGIRNFGITLRDSLNEGYAGSRKTTKQQQLVQKPITQKVPESERNLK